MKNYPSAWLKAHFWRQGCRRTRRQDACATRVARASSLRVHEASQLRVPRRRVSNQILSLSCCLALALVRVATAAELGDAAAPLQIAEWIKGKPVDLSTTKGKQIVVVEFWATWCGPCRTSIPHLTELQKKFKDVVFVGISDEDAPTVKKFVAKMGDKMDYTVAIDTDRKTSAGYMAAFGIGGIPHAFIVDKDGRTVWQGHPMDGLEEALTEVVAGKFDLAKVKKREGAKKKLEAFYEAAGSGQADAKLDQMAKELEALDAEIGGLEPGKKFNAADVRKEVRFQGLMRDYQIAMMSGKGGTNLDRIEKLLTENAPKDFDLNEYKEGIAVNKTFSDYLRAASGRGETNRLGELARQVGAAKPNNPRMQLQLAWAILDDEQIKTRDFELAAQLAKSAVESTESKDPGSLYVYARALFDGGKTADAVTWQKKAVEAAGDNEDGRKQLEETLQKYQAKAAGK